MCLLLDQINGKIHICTPWVLTFRDTQLTILAFFSSLSVTSFWQLASNLSVKTIFFIYLLCFCFPQQSNWAKTLESNRKWTVQEAGCLMEEVGAVLFGSCAHRRFISISITTAAFINLIYSLCCHPPQIFISFHFGRAKKVQWPYKWIYFSFFSFYIMYNLSAHVDMQNSLICEPITRLK